LIQLCRWFPSTSPQIRCAASDLLDLSPGVNPWILFSALELSDIDTAAADSLKVLDPKWPIREADISLRRTNLLTLINQVRGESATLNDVPKLGLEKALSITFHFLIAGPEIADWLTFARTRIVFAASATHENDLR